jgi:hypothetical protein
VSEYVSIGLTVSCKRACWARRHRTRSTRTRRPYCNTHGSSESNPRPQRTLTYNPKRSRVQNQPLDLRLTSRKGLWTRGWPKLTAPSPLELLERFLSPLLCSTMCGAWVSMRGTRFHPAAPPPSAPPPTLPQPRADGRQWDCVVHSLLPIGGTRSAVSMEGARSCHIWWPLQEKRDRHSPARSLPHPGHPAYPAPSPPTNRITVQTSNGYFRATQSPRHTPCQHFGLRGPTCA